MNLKHRGDLAMIGDSLLLDREEAKVLGRLDVGWGLVKLQGRWHRPFLVRFPEFAIEKGRVSDEDLRTRSNPLAPEATGSESLTPSSAGSDARTSSREISAQPLLPRGAEEAPTALEEGVLRLLRDVVEHPTSTIPRRFSRCHLSTGSGARLLSSAVARGFLSSAHVRTPEGRARWLELTEEGCRTLGIPFARSPREGGVEHRYWVARAKAWLERQGYLVGEAVAVEGGFVDLVGTKGGERVAVEVETGKSDVAGNVLRLRGQGFGRVVVVALTAPAREALANVPRDVAAEIRLTVLGPGEVHAGDDANQGPTGPR